MKNASAMHYSALAFCVAALGACGLDPTGSALSSSGVTTHTTSADASAGSKPGNALDAAADDALAPPARDASHGDVGAGSDDAGGPACHGDGAGVAFVAPMATSPTYGGIGGQPFDDVCTTDEALVGLNLVGGSQLSSISHIQAVCAPISLDAQCAVAIGAPVSLVDHGSTPGTPQPLTCPSGSVVVGVRVSTGLFVNAIEIDCAPLVHDPAGTTFTRGAVVTVGSLGGNGGMANPPYACPDGQVANELAGGTGGWLQSVRIGCATAFIP